MPLSQNPDEFFNKLLTAYPMTNPTPQTPPCHAEGLTSDDIPAGPLSEQELREQWNAQADEFNQWESLDSSEQLAWAQARAIATDRARRPQQEQMAEALRRLWRWGGRHGWDCQTFRDVYDWIDAGMTGPLPPLPGRIAVHQGEQPPADETTTTEPPC